MAEIKSFRELNVYKSGREEAKKIYLMTKSFPKEETYSLTDQIRRCSRAVNALVAESWGRRRYEAAFINKLTEAMGEAMETQTWLDHALDCDYITSDQHRELDYGWQQIGAMLTKMIQRAATFCPPTSK